MYDIDIREPLFDYLDEKYGKNRIIEEKNMGRSRADVIMILPDMIVGYEIKSDADTYERLKRQATDYNKYCDRNYIVIGKSHLKHVEEHIASFWGILCVSFDRDEKNKLFVDISEIRPALPNNKCKITHQLKWLWRQELAHIQKQNTMYKYTNKSKAFVIDKLMDKVPEEILKKQMCEELFQRDYTTIQ